MTTQWSSLANGDTTNIEYKTTYTYDDNGNLLSQPDVDNTAIARHT